MLPTKARVSKDAPLPRHLQVRQILLDMMTTGIWPPGAKIPAETEIARSLGVSKMTVNKAILALTAEGLMYREVGRGTFISTSSGRLENRRLLMEATHGIEVITVKPTEWIPNDVYACALLLAMRRCVGQREVKLSMRHLRGMEYAARWQEGQSDGWLLLAPLEEDVAGLRALAEAGAKAVVLGASWPEVALPCVDSDNSGGAKLAVDHLVGLGHRRLGLLHGAPQAVNTRDRIYGFQSALRDHALVPRTEWMVDAGADWRIVESRRDAVRHWLLHSERPTAIVAAGAFLAQELLEMARGIGLRVPEDLSLVSFDDLPEASPTGPGLTTVLQPLEEMGREAITGLQTMLQSPEKCPGPWRTLLPCRLKVRESTAPPQK